MINLLPKSFKGLATLMSVFICLCSFAQDEKKDGLYYGDSDDLKSSKKREFLHGHAFKIGQALGINSTTLYYEFFNDFEDREGYSVELGIGVNYANFILKNYNVYDNNFLGPNSGFHVSLNGKYYLDQKNQLYGMGMFQYTNYKISGREINWLFQPEGARANTEIINSQNGVLTAGAGVGAQVVRGNFIVDVSAGVRIGARFSDITVTDYLDANDCPYSTLPPYEQIRCHSVPYNYKDIAGYIQVPVYIKMGYFLPF